MAQSRYHRQCPWLFLDCRCCWRYCSGFLQALPGVAAFDGRVEPYYQACIDQRPLSGVGEKEVQFNVLVLLEKERRNRNVLKEWRLVLQGWA